MCRTGKNETEKEFEAGRMKKNGTGRREERGAKRRGTAVGWINGWCDRSQPPRY